MTFMLTTVNIVVFGIAYAMLHVALGVGAAFGLFALFGILRFRTGTLDVTEMSFLFASLALAVMNSSGLSGMTMTELILINITTLLALIVGARLLIVDRVEYEQTKVVYDKADLLATGDAEAALVDLRSRTGLDVKAVTVVALDLTTNTATLRLHHVAAGPRVIRRMPDPSENGSNGDNGEPEFMVDLSVDSLTYRT